MPSLGEAPSGGAKTFWLLLGRLPKVTRCKSGTIRSRYRSNGYVLPPPKKTQPHPSNPPTPPKLRNSRLHNIHTLHPCRSASCKLRQSRLTEQRPRIHIQPRLAHTRHQTHRQQRMPAQLEEMVMPPYPLQLQDLRPNPRHQGFHLTNRRFIRTADHRLQPGSGSALRSSLPAGLSGNTSSCTKAAGTMYSGNCSST